MATLDKILQYLLITLMAVMTIDVLWGVFTRYALGNQASWSEELARFILIWIGMLGTAYATGQRMHLSIDLLGPSLPPARQRLLQMLIIGFILFFAIAVMVIGGGRLLYISAKLGQTSAALGIPMTVIYSVVPISGILIVIYKLRDFVALKNDLSWK
jgi:TRAP-type C4-dicarboxylate transport system permease small subunit